MAGIEFPDFGRISRRIPDSAELRLVEFISGQSLRFARWVVRAHRFDLPLCLFDRACGPLPEDIDQLDGNRTIVARDVLRKEKNADRYR
jgi:hypothetical protein